VFKTLKWLLAVAVALVVLAGATVVVWLNRPLGFAPQAGAMVDVTVPPSPTAHREAETAKAHRG